MFKTNKHGGIPWSQSKYKLNTFHTYQNTSFENCIYADFHVLFILLSMQILLQFQFIKREYWITVHLNTWFGPP